MSDTVQRPPLAVDVIEAEEILQYIAPALLKLDYNDTNIKQIIISGSCAFFALIFASIILICSLFSKFRDLRLKFKVFLSLSLVRSIYGFFGTVIGSYALFSTTNLEKDIVFGRTATASVGMLVTAGFFIFELATLIVSDIAFKSFSKMLIIHHALGVVSYCVCISYNVNFSIGCKVLILEMSTPFSCVCYMLLKAGMEHSALWRINQMVLIHSFHIRNIVECYLWYITYRNWHYIWAFFPTSVFILTYFSLATLTFVMTPYWGHKKTQQLFNPIDWNFQESRKQKPNDDINDNDISKKSN